MDLVNCFGQTTPVSALSAKPVAAFCGIGNPEAFRRTLAGLGARVKSSRVFSDHHAYTPADIKELSCWAKTQADDCIMVTTQKDLVKVGQTDLGGRPLWAVRIGLEVVSGREMLESRLRAVLNTH
jgi:tetraacyldisaccharide 4'-kinase